MDITRLSDQMKPLTPTPRGDPAMTAMLHKMLLQGVENAIGKSNESAARQKEMLQEALNILNS